MGHWDQIFPWYLQALQYVPHQVDNYLHLQFPPQLWTMLRRIPLTLRSLFRDLLPSTEGTSSLISILRGKFQGRNYHKPCLTGMTSNGCSILYLALTGTHGLSITNNSQELLMSCGEYRRHLPVPSLSPQQPQPWEKQEVRPDKVMTTQINITIWDCNASSTFSG